MFSLIFYSSCNLCIVFIVLFFLKLLFFSFILFLLTYLCIFASVLKLLQCYKNKVELRMAQQRMRNGEDENENNN